MKGMETTSGGGEMTQRQVDGLVGGEVLEATVPGCVKELVVVRVWGQTMEARAPGFSDRTLMLSTASVRRKYRVKSRPDLDVVV